MPTKAAIYLRISRDFEMTGEAIERQREDCKTTCAVKHWEVVKEYVDQSISAYSGKNRPGFDQMIADYKAGLFDVIVAWKLDRLTRSTAGFAAMLDELREQKLRICTSDLGDVDLSKPDAKFTTSILVNVAEFESARKSERSKRANLQRARKVISAQVRDASAMTDTSTSSSPKLRSFVHCTSSTSVGHP